ncbi:uncharacterized protein BX663DRAFT_332152 [Cokeromyces recurvatus]|uniref:uncharacterized protein n=1 Tax=Cokeromyces recurvatus TaxID=90255 RepID=UPI00221E59F1|nr:uncharacterized protein BX663DRAFT_332152 [Cokeromyces recurvatus]KAI7904114.1 hypothetical protein BX663DRAFT_332152 [Cokeromyces recurvatus]
MVPEKALDTDNVPIGLIISSENNDLYSLNNNMLLSPKLHNPLINNNSISIKSPSTSTPSNIKLKKENDILSKPTILSPSITPSPSITASKTYTGGILQPNNSLDNSNNNNTINLSAKSSSSNDLYAALRNLSIGNNNTTTVKNKDLISFEGTFNKSKNTVALLRDLDPLFNKQSNDS